MCLLRACVGSCYCILAGRSYRKFCHSLNFSILPKTWVRILIRSMLICSLKKTAIYPTAKTILITIVSLSYFRFRSFIKTRNLSFLAYYNQPDYPDDTNIGAIVQANESFVGFSPTRKELSDPEYFAYECLEIENVERVLNETVEALCERTQVSSFFRRFPRESLTKLRKFSDFTIISEAVITQ